MIAASRNASEPAKTLPDPLNEAAEWFVLLDSGEATAVDRQRWLDWRTADPANADAWQRTETTLTRLSGIPREAAGASSQALRLRDTGNTPPGKRSWRSRAAALALTTISGLLAAWQGYQHSDLSADAMTAVGEQRNVRLADGSHLQLDTDSAADIDFTARERRIRLRRGQIMIETAADPAPIHRPFSVDTKDGRITALGTRFSVEQRPGETQVIVLEDRVSVTPHHATGAVIVQAGESLRFTVKVTDALQTALPAEAAWSKGMLLADDLPLPEFAHRLGRYMSVPLTTDASVNAVRVSGAFPLADPERALDAVARTRPVRAEKQAERWLLTAKEAPPKK